MVPRGQALERVGRHAAWVRDAIRAGQRYHIRTKSPWRHNVTNLGAMTALLGLMVLIARFSTILPPLAYVPLAAIAFGWCYFALFVLVVHEASHSMFIISSNRSVSRWLNRAFGWAVAVPFSVHYGNHWERGHHEHHVRPLEEADPQRFIAIGRPLLVSMVCIVLVPGFLFIERTVLRAQRAGGKSSSTKPVIAAFVVFWVAVLGACAWLVGWPLAVSLFLGVHVLSAWNKVKGGLEHGGAIGLEASSLFRSRTTLFAGRALLMPFNITLHFEHHLNFNIPWYDLVRYHRDLRAIVPPEVWTDVINANPLRQLSGRLGGLSESARAASASVPAAPS